MDTENVIHKNRGEDMKVLVNLGDDYTPQCAFAVRFTTTEFGCRAYTCTGENGVYKNCLMADATHALCLLDNHDLMCGRLMMELAVRYPDPQMPDGTLRLVSRGPVRVLDETGAEAVVEITHGHSDHAGMTHAAAALLEPMLKGERGEKGDTGAAATIDTALSATSPNAVSNAAVTAALAAKADTAHTHTEYAPLNHSHTIPLATEQTAGLMTADMVRTLNELEETGGGTAALPLSADDIDEICR